MTKNQIVNGILALGGLFVTILIADLITGYSVWNIFIGSTPVFLVLLLLSTKM